MKNLLTAEAKENIFNQVMEDTKVTPYYYIMIVLSCTIVTYGLLQNSTAVIIGAMLISPLMGPLIGGALAVSEGDNNLLKIAVRTEILGAILTVAIAIGLALIIPEKVVTDEILSRTSPTLLDLIIALAAGAAGTYAICYRPNSAIIPGVAISTALMPPLCVVGIGISNKDYAIATGALLLFLANIIAINFASILVFNIFGFNNFYNQCKQCGFSLKNLTGNLIYSIVLVCLISVPLAFFMYRSYQANSVNNTVRNTIQEEMDKIAPKAEIEFLSTDRLEDAYLVDSVIRSTKALTKDNIRQIENILEYKLTKPVKLDADIVLVQRISNSDSINGYNDLISSLVDVSQEPVEVIKIQTPEQIIEGAADEKLSLLEGGILDNFSIKYEKNTSIYYIDLYVNYEGEVDDKFEKSMISVLEDKLKRRVILTVHKINTSEPDTEEDDSPEGGPGEDGEKATAPSIGIQ